MEVSKDCPSSDSIPKFKHDFRSLIHDDKFEKSIRRNLKKQDFKSRSQSRNTSSSMMSDDTPEGLKKPMTKIEWIQTRLKLGKKGKIMSKVGTIENNDRIQPHFAQLHVTNFCLSYCIGLRSKLFFICIPRCAKARFWKFPDFYIMKIKL